MFLLVYTLFFISNAFFSTQPQCCLTFSWIELQMLFRCCLIHISIIILRHFLYLPYLCPCLDLYLFMSYLCNLFFIFIFIFSMINHVILWIQTQLFFSLFFRICPIILDDNVDEEWIILKQQNFSLRVLLRPTLYENILSCLI